MIDFISVVGGILSVVSIIIALIVLKDVFGEFYCHWRRDEELNEALRFARKIRDDAKKHSEL